MIWRRFTCLVVLLGVLLAIAIPWSPAQALPLLQTSDPNQKARQLLDRMTPEERVGQLFLVTFRGRDINAKDSKIMDLIANRHIGGVMLKSANDNFGSSTTFVEDIYRMNADLQAARYNSSQKAIRNAFGYTYTPQNIPLFIGISQEGDLYPNDQILSELTPLPSEMALGATWNLGLVAQVGKILGRELSSLGINLVFGPSLDLAEGPGSEGSDVLGVQLFGGNPFWVGKMGQAYIQGIHEGSTRRVAVIPHSFPGIGGADRSPDNQVATVRKIQDQLIKTELQPYFAVTGGSSSADASADGLEVANIRYQGWQGVIRPNTRPLSFDTAALDQVLALPDLVRWRQGGGLLVSDNLGSVALQNFYAATGQAYDPRQVALSVFLGGSDLLFTDNLIAQGDADSYTTLKNVLDFFVQKYRGDTAFAQRVDISVLRLLALKYRMYSEFSPDQVTPKITGLSLVGGASQATFDIARQAVTILHPSQSELSQVLPRPPDLRERMIFLTDVTTYRQCGQCSSQPVLAVDALQNIVIRLYGPRGGGQINAANLMSYSYLDLKYYLDDNKDKIPAGLDDNLKLADWIVVAQLDNHPSRLESQAFRQLLARRPELLRNKKVVVFAFNSPYLLDATDISLVSAYYALYSKTPPFIEVAARILFQELTPIGALPVSFSGVGYDLATALSPEPSQVIPLEVDTSTVAISTPTLTTPTISASGTPVPTQTIVPTAKVGDLIPLRTGVILDRNRNPVPDGTQVQFIFTATGSEGGLAQQITATTVNGIARAAYRIQSSGSLEVRVVSLPALSSKQLRLIISPTGQVQITAVTPTVITPTPTPTATSTVTPTSTATPTPTPTPPPPPKAGTTEWIFALLIAWGVGGIFYWIGRRTGSLRWGVRWGFLAAMGGLLTYTYLVAGMPGGTRFIETSGPSSLVWITLAGSFVGWLVGLFWRLGARRSR